MIKKIKAYLDKLPYFESANLKILDIPDYYLKIILHRLERRGELIRFKRGFYVSTRFLEKMKAENKFSFYLEYLSNRLYAPSYLSLEYVLYENNVLTEIPKNFTLMTKNKTANFSNKLGTFVYHRIKDALFAGYEVKNAGELVVYKAAPGKALFDFLYLRKNLISAPGQLEELRLNYEPLSEKDRRLFREFVKLEGSMKMKKIASLVFSTEGGSASGRKNA